MFFGGTARMIASSALMSAIPSATDRGAYMSLTASIQQISGGFAAALAGWIITSNADGSLQHFDQVGNVIVGTSVLTAVMMVVISRMIRKS
jgi:hypothetical protein